MAQEKAIGSLLEVVEKMALEDDREPGESQIRKR